MYCAFGVDLELLLYMFNFKTSMSAVRHEDIKIPLDTPKIYLLSLLISLQKRLVGQSKLGSKNRLGVSSQLAPGLAQLYPSILRTAIYIIFPVVPTMPLTPLAPLRHFVPHP